MVITTNMRIIIIVSTITLALIVLVGIVYHQRSSFIHPTQMLTNNQINTDFFVINESESVAIKAACKKSLEELLEDTTNAASFYVLGHVILKAKNEGRQLDAQDLQDAYYCFARAASLGFSPALYQMWRMFIDGVVPMPIFLALVYLNLAASEHPELNSFYDGLRSAALEKSGKRIVKEIERIARYKKNIIAQNISLLKSAKNNEHIEIQIITDEDELCGYEYWDTFARRK